VTALASLLVVHAVAIPVMLHDVLRTPRDQTIVGQVEEFASRSQMDDSWRPMRAATAYSASAPGRDIYEEIFFRRRIKFQYPPTALLFTRDFAASTLNHLSWLAVWATAAVSAGLLVSCAFRHGLLDGPRDTLLCTGAALGLCLTFYPLLKAYTLGQIQVWVDAAFAIAVWMWSRNRQLSAGVVVGVICLIKPPLAPLAIWGVVRRHWRFAAGVTIVAVLGLSLSLATYGVSSHLSYLRVLAFIGPRGEAYYPNQSVNGLLNRLFLNGDILKFDDLAFSPVHPIVAWGSAAVSLLLYAAALAGPTRLRQPDRMIDFAVMTLTATVASPIAWEHHYGVTLPLFAVLAPMVVRPRHPRVTAWLLALAFVLVGQYVHATRRLAYTPWNLLLSYTFFGGLLLLGIAYRLLPTIQNEGGISRQDSKDKRTRP
jgi:hypothetical protein